MTETNDNLPAHGRDSPDFDSSVIVASGKVAGQVARLASALLGFAALAYFVGWARMHGYYSQFGADWVGLSLPTSVHISNSVAPLGYMLFFSITLVTDLASGRNPASARKLHYAAIFVGAATLLASYAGPDRLAIAAAHMSVIVWVVLAAEFFGSLIMSLRSNEYAWLSRDVLALWGAAYLGLYVAPLGLGSAEGRNARNPELSNLPVVQVEEQESGTEWRLLASGGDLLYLVDLERPGKHPRVRIVAADLTSWIQGPDNKDVAEAQDSDVSIEPGNSKPID